jgi:hypothetical protein
MPAIILLTRPVLPEARWFPADKTRKKIDKKETSFVTGMALPFSEERDMFFQGSASA